MPMQVLGAMYTVGLIIASFVFAALAQTFNEMRLLGYGMLIWAGGVLGTGLSTSFGAMLFCRVRPPTRVTPLTPLPVSFCLVRLCHQLASPSSPLPVL